MTNLSRPRGDSRCSTQLCFRWSVHGAAAHLVVPLDVGIPTFMLVSRGNFDRANIRLTRRQARLPFEGFDDRVRRKADQGFTPPGAGPEAPLTDLLVHDLDIRWPLGLSRPAPAERLQKSLTFLTTPAARMLVSSGALDGLRLEAEDVAWASGTWRRRGRHLACATALTRGYAVRTETTTAFWWSLGDSNP